MVLGTLGHEGIAVPRYQVLGYLGIGLSRIRDIGISGHQDIRISGYWDIVVSGFLGFTVGRAGRASGFDGLYGIRLIAFFCI